MTDRDSRSVLHQLFSLIISQKIAYKESDRIHKKLYSMLDCPKEEQGTLDHLMSLEEDELVDVLGKHKLSIMRRVDVYVHIFEDDAGKPCAEFNDKEVSKLVWGSIKLSGIGVLTVKNCLLRLGMDPGWINNDRAVTNLLIDIMCKLGCGNPRSFTSYLDGTLYSKLWRVTKMGRWGRSRWVKSTVSEFKKLQKTK